VEVGLLVAAIMVIVLVYLAFLGPILTPIVSS
jgi:hypothetical protein